MYVIIGVIWLGLSLFRGPGELYWAGPYNYYWSIGKENGNDYLEISAL